jgi:hypothetical protein
MQTLMDKSAMGGKNSESHHLPSSFGTVTLKLTASEPADVLAIQLYTPASARVTEHSSKVAVTTLGHPTDTNMMLVRSFGDRTTPFCVKVMLPSPTPSATHVANNVWQLGTTMSLDGLTIICGTPAGKEHYITVCIW